MAQTLYHRLILPADANHKNTLYAGSLLRLVLEAGYSTAWRNVGPQANLVLRRVLNLECCVRFRSARSSRLREPFCIARMYIS
jgi:acyl-CoA hydrolase